MNKIFTFFVFLVSVTVFAQSDHRSCGFDHVLGKLEISNPEFKKNRLEAESRIRALDKTAQLKKAGIAKTKNGLYTGKIYEIPVVVHVIESSAAANAKLKVTDQEIIDWIDRANKMYATTYGNGMYPEGSGPTGGAVIPFKLVLAQRSPSCTPTNGIVRYDGSTLANYDTQGVNGNKTGGVNDSDIKNSLAPHWPESSYFNIYVVIGFDGQQQLSYGLMGYASFPTNYDYNYDSFMKVATIKNTHDTTLTHEMGHAFGLYHTFQGVDYDKQDACPVNNDCTTDGDRVCDTSPSKSMYGQTVPSDSTIDPCTNVYFDGTQYNVMNYTNDERKFTEGQRDRAVLMMLDSRSTLLNSTAGKPMSETIPAPALNVKAASCNPTGIDNPYNYAIGPYKVVFGSINNMSAAYDADEKNPSFYDDYTVATCIRPAQYTDISPTAKTPLRIFLMNGFAQQDDFVIRVWIDYNNNGAFESGELAINSRVAIPSGNGGSVSFNITPPATAVKNTYLRMRVLVDALTFMGTQLPEVTSCSQLQFGQMEDYAVRLNDGSLSTVDVKEGSDVKLVYTKAINKLQLFGKDVTAFGDFAIYDVAGKLVQKGNSKTNEVQINRTLQKGVYIVNFNDRGKTESKKIIVN